MKQNEKSWIWERDLPDRNERELREGWRDSIQNIYMYKIVKEQNYQKKNLTEKKSQSFYAIFNL